MNEPAYRKELKYLIDMRDYFLLKARLSAIFATDSNSGSNGTYRIRSLYFDDFRNSAYFEKLSGLENRAKYRLRYYNDNTDYIRFEKKVKNGNNSYKVSALLTYEEALKAASGDYSSFIMSEQAVLREFYLANSERCFKPNVITDYQREAYVYKPSNVRITFDSDIRTALTGTELFNKSLPLVPVIGSEQMILEVKYDINLPKVVSDILKCVGKMQTSISKFTLCKKYIALNDWEVDRWA